MCEETNESEVTTKTDNNCNEFAESNKLEDENMDELEDLEVLIGDDASRLVETEAMTFIEKTYPEELDEEQFRDRIYAKYPAIRRTAINDILLSKGLSYAMSMSSASSDHTPPLVLEKTIHRSLDEFIRNRMRGDYDCDLPDYFYESVRNKNTPREAIILAFRKLTDPKLNAGIIERFSRRLISEVLAKCDLIDRKAAGDVERNFTKNETQEVKGVVRRMNDLEGEKRWFVR